MQNEQQFTSGLSFDLDDLFSALPIEEKKKEIDPNEDRFIIFEQQIDTKTIKRTRNRITPAVCLVCGLDGVQLAYEQNRIPVNKYEDLPPHIQTIMQNWVKRHTAARHSNAESLILSKSELPRQWLDTSS